MTFRSLDVESSKPLWVAVAALTAGSDAGRPCGMLFLAVRDLSKGHAACEEYGMLHGFDNIAMGWEGLGGAFGGCVWV